MNLLAAFCRTIIFSLIFLTTGCHGNSTCKKSTDYGDKSHYCSNVTDITEVTKHVHTISIESMPTITLSFSKQFVLDDNLFTDPIYNNIRILSVVDSNLSDIKPRFFTGLNRLWRLDINRCGLNEIHADLFLGMKGLNYLDLQGNNIKTIHGSPFREMKFLDTLNLNKNNITSVSKDTFVGLNNVREIHLKMNQIQRLESGVCKDFSHLYKLDMRYNNIDYISDTAFAKFSELALLYLSGNLLKNMTNSLNLFRLQTLKIDDCDFDEIPINLLNKLTNLQNLYLRNNKIKRFDPKVWDIWPVLKYVAISGNKLESIDVESFKKMIKEMDPYSGFTDNPWNCQHEDMLLVKSYCNTYVANYDDHSVLYFENGILDFDKIFECNKNNKSSV